MSSDKLDVLFVDDEPRRSLTGSAGSCAIVASSGDALATSGEAALKLLAERPADVIVSDMRMPGMSGGQLLTRVRDLHPHAVRIILSGQTDQADLIGELGCIHQYLQKPCDGEVLCQAIERTRALAQVC